MSLVRFTNLDPSGRKIKKLTTSSKWVGLVTKSVSEMRTPL